MSRQPTILTNHGGHDRSVSWQQKTWMPVIEPRFRVALLQNFYAAWQLFRRRRGFQVVVLGGGAQIDLCYQLLQRLWPFHRRPLIKIDCLWYRSEPLLQRIKAGLFRWLDKDVVYYVVWCRREIADYARVFGLPAHKFVFIPYHTTLVDCDPTEPGDYVFSGGNFARDYRTLVAAMRGLDLKLIIACTNAAALAGIDLPANVSVVGVDHSTYLRLMAKSWINVVALDTTLLHSGGQQTFLNAMALGKPTIVTDPAGAADYIESGVDGLLVAGGDVAGLRAALLRCHENRDFAEKLAAKGREKARRLDTEASLAALAELAMAVTQPEFRQNVWRSSRIEGQ